MAFVKDHTNKKYGRLTAICQTGIRDGHATWEFICECGNKVVRRVSHVTGHRGTSSCGCLPKERATKHGHVADGKIPSEYRIWSGIKARCLNENSSAYASYGGRGITMCDRWHDSFENFLADMGTRPSSKHSVDRIDNDGDYSPTNCHWATATEQARNKRMLKNNKSGTKGVCKMFSKWKAYIYVDKKLICLGYFYTLEDAIAARKAAELKYWQT